ncbi:damage-control phosphatase ARMT1 family protein [Kitasatospora sp. NBC_01246]|uniref:damage-control phosphatase ARMT1 family protein n=1 Tax=Kitasatospora sp. NBC_01246 TaxID=2903570 RepID=UPI002E34DE0B|nr:damage-control phosphatase ARMT1 family protein [Kitasatospora sp. NBC_01246]
MPTSAPLIRSDVPGSFPWGVFHERHPKLLGQVLDALPYGPGERAAVERLLVESTTGVLTPPGAGVHDRERWLAWGEGLWGRPWGEAPFLWAENWFYHRLLDATGYFRPGAWQGIDPFGPFKAAELAGPAVDDELAALEPLGELPPRQRARALVTSALWGNRADLSFGLTAADDGPVAELVADDSAVIWTELERTRGGRVCVVADNAGRELLPDLVLIDHLLDDGLAAEVALYVKPRPYFVSDATPADLLATVERLRAAPTPRAAAIGRRLWRALGTGELTVRADAFFCAPLTFHDLPAGLRAEFAGAALTVFKGDLNYRRLVGDRLWPPTTPFAAAVAHFPSSVAALRTLKSDVVVGVEPAVLARLEATGAPWRTTGRHAVVQVHRRAAAG